MRQEGMKLVLCQVRYLEVFHWITMKLANSHKPTKLQGRALRHDVFYQVIAFTGFHTTLGCMNAIEADDKYNLGYKGVHSSSDVFT